MAALHQRGVTRSDDYYVQQTVAAATIHVQCAIEGGGNLNNGSTSGTSSDSLAGAAETLVVAADADGALWIYGALSGHMRCLVDAANETVSRRRFDALCAMCVLPSGRLALTLDALGRLRVWDLAQRRLIGMTAVQGFAAADYHVGDGSGGGGVRFLYEEQQCRLLLFDANGWCVCFL